MARDRSKDNLLFNCGQQWEHDYVVSLYSTSERSNVREFLKTSCASGLIKNSTHMEVYELIKKHLGYAIPV